MRKAQNIDNPLIKDFHSITKKVNQSLIQLNHSLYSGAPLKIVQKNVQVLWGAIHDFRLSRPDTDSLYWQSLNLLAYEATRIRNMITVSENENRDNIKKEYQKLKSYTRSFEKAIVKEWYFIETNIETTMIGTIPWVALISKKSQITVRRYIADDRIRGYQLFKRCWVPIEEAETLRDWYN